MNELRYFSIFILFLTGGCKSLSIQIFLELLKWSETDHWHGIVTWRCYAVFFPMFIKSSVCIAWELMVVFYRFKRLVRFGSPRATYKKILLSCMKFFGWTNVVAAYVVLSFLTFQPQEQLTYSHSWMGTRKCLCGNNYDIYGRCVSCEQTITYRDSSIAIKSGGSQEFLATAAVAAPT